MRKWAFIFALIACFDVNAWESCGTDATGNTANCEYQIIDGTLTIRGVGENGNIGYWWNDEGWTNEDFTSPWKGKTFQNIIVEDSVKDLGSWGFFGVTSQNLIQLPNVDTIGYSALRSVTAREVVISDSTNLISEGAFVEANIQKIELSDSIETIGPWVFRNSLLRDIVIPDNVKNIDVSAFSGCSNLQSLTIGENTILGAIFDWSGEERSENLNNLKIYCTGDTAKCDANLKAAGYSDFKSVKATTQKINGVTYVYDDKGKLVTTSGRRTEKRIYTVDEANRVSGKINRFSIRYR